MPNKTVQTTPFNFDEIYTNLSTKFKDAGYDNNPGSNVSQLITAMAYLTSMLNVTTAVNINETILSLATKRDNALTDARELGYEIQHKQSYTYRLTLNLTGGGGTYSIPKHTEFTDNGKSYYYLGNSIELTGQPDGTLLEILVVQGKLYKSVDYPESLVVETVNVKNEAGVLVPQSYIDIPFVDVEENGIECYVSYYDQFGNYIQNEEWLKSDIFMLDNDLVIKRKFFRRDDIQYRTPRIYFELSGIGQGIRLGSIVNLNILTTDGINGGMTLPLAASNIVTTLQNITVQDVVLVTEGADEESIQSIKLNAPKFYNSANRAVIASDYQAISNRQASVKDSYIWGGEVEFPKSPGHIWFSFLPSSLQRTFRSDSFNKIYTLNDNLYIDWDYTLTPSADPVNAPGPYEAQVAAANLYYSKRFIEDSEIRSSEVTSDGVLIQPGIWDVLDNFKIPTLEFHHRHPIVLDFDYDVEILRYDVITSKSEFNQSVFDIIDGFFTGANDTTNLESFNSEYFQSSLIKRVDKLLTDNSGYNTSLRTNILLTLKNVQQENTSSDYMDIFIPLEVPFEPYFDNSGFLLYDVLPKIDTNSFIDYRSAADIANNINTPTTNLYVDWSDIQGEITAGTLQKTKDIIIAPVVVDLTETRIALGVEPTVTLQSFGIYPDDPSTLDLGTPTYNNTVVTHIAVGGTETVLVKDVDYTVDPMVDPKLITLTVPLSIGESLRIQSKAQCGNYYIFNSYKKYITVQLFVDGRNFNSGVQQTQNYQDPKSYLTTVDELYDFTIDSFYLTTNGYVLTNPALTTSLTGPVVKTITPNTYYGSPLKIDLFRRDRKLNLNYNSPNFSVGKNLIPRLNSVTFK